MKKNYIVTNEINLKKATPFAQLGDRFARSLFQTKNGYVIHADINASFNIIRKVSGDNIYNFVNMVAIKDSNPKRWKIKIAQTADRRCGITS